MTGKAQTNLNEHLGNIEMLLDKIIDNEDKRPIKERSGTVFYSGYETLFNNYGVYFLGANPKGSPDTPGSIKDSLNELRQIKENSEEYKSADLYEDLNECEKCKIERIKYYKGYYNAYLDECWGTKCKNSFQNNIVDAFNLLCLDLRITCGSNFVFQRSNAIKEIPENIQTQYIYVHDYIINEIINPSVIIIAWSKGYDDYFKKNWDDDVKKPISLNTTPEGKPLPASPCYIESEDDTKILCYLPHFSWQGHYNKFSECKTAIDQMRIKIHEKLEKRSTLKLPKWKFKKTWQSLL